MDTIEVQGKSVDEAKRLAAEKLGVEVDRISTEVLEESKGLFGKAVVKVRASVLDESPKPAPKKPERAPKPPKVAEEAKEEKPPARARTRARKEEPVPAPEATVDDEELDEPETTDQRDVVATDEDADDLAEIVNEILEIADMQARVKPKGLNGRYVNLELDGKDVAFLVGKHGEVLNAFQYLLNVIANRQLGSGVRVTLDGNNYRRRREEALCNLALQIAEQVRDRGEEAVLDALPAFERRVVHKALADFDGVTTYSEGEEPSRRVVIAPAE